MITESGIRYSIDLFNVNLSEPNRTVGGGKMESGVACSGFLFLRMCGFILEM